MNPTICIKASKVTPDAWRYIKARFPRKYVRLQRDIKAWGLSKVKIYFTKELKPVQIAMSY